MSGDTSVRLPRIKDLVAAWAPIVTLGTLLLLGGVAWGQLEELKKLPATVADVEHRTTQIEERDAARHQFLVQLAPLLNENLSKTNKSLEELTKEVTALRIAVARLQGEHKDGSRKQTLRR